MSCTISGATPGSRRILRRATRRGPVSSAGAWTRPSRRPAPGGRHGPIPDRRRLAQKRPLTPAVTVTPGMRTSEIWSAIPR